jgi:hypothetical protein
MQSEMVKTVRWDRDNRLDASKEVGLATEN